MRYLGTIMLLTLFYLGITSNLEWTNILAGLLVATGVALLVRAEGELIRWRDMPRAILALIQYVVIMAYDLVTSGFQVAGIVLSRSIPLRQGIIALPTQVKSEVGAALSAHAITLTPGEMVVEMEDDGLLYTHCLDVSHAESYIQEAQELREDLLDKIVP